MRTVPARWASRLSFCTLLASAACAGADDSLLGIAMRGGGTVTFDVVAQPEAPDEASGADDSVDHGSVLSNAASQATAVRFGDAGSSWLTIGGGYAHDFSGSNDFNLTGAWTYFLDEDIEVTFEGALWALTQDGDDALGLNPSVIFRWHFAHSETKSWTAFADIGIGLLVSSERVPAGGTELNFTPRVGVGFTHELPGTSARLQVGLRWHHISNARIRGQDRNPARDAPMVFVGLIFAL